MDKEVTEQEMSDAGRKYAENHLSFFQPTIEQYKLRSKNAFIAGIKWYRDELLKQKDGNGN